MRYLQKRGCHCFSRIWSDQSIKCGLLNTKKMHIPLSFSYSSSSTIMDTLQRYLDSANDMLQGACIKVLSKGRIPRHIGFILDGNRRFARKAGAESTKFGHYEGFRQLQMVRDSVAMLTMGCSWFIL